jgi:hypothetical protein
MEKKLKALAGIPAAIFKLTASANTEALKSVKITALLAGVVAAFFDWRVVFLLAFTYKKAGLERSLRFKKLANRLLFKNLCEAILFGGVLALFQGGEEATFIFLIYQSFNLILLIP